MARYHLSYEEYDGVYRWIFDRGVPFHNEQGNFVGYICSCIDVTEQIEARNLLIQSRDSEIKKLRGLLPICSSCKKIRDDHGYWQQIEEYIRQHSGAKFTHGLCPACANKLYPDLFDHNGKPNRAASDVHEGEP
jgi:hypothetical protein